MSVFEILSSLLPANNIIGSKFIFLAFCLDHYAERDANGRNLFTQIRFVDESQDSTLLGEHPRRDST